jgi:Lipocalin-like domain
MSRLRGCIDGLGPASRQQQESKSKVPAHSTGEAICSAERPKFASNNRLQGTPEENKAAVHGCNPHWGRYAVTEDGAILFKIAHAMFANWEGTEQKRLYTIKGDELTYKVPTASGGGTAQLVWKRAK